MEKLNMLMENICKILENEKKRKNSKKKRMVVDEGQTRIDG